MNVRVKHVRGINFGRNIVINQAALLDGRGGLEIHDNVDIAERVNLWSMTHSANSKNHETICRKTIIESNVWLGAGATVLAGIKVGYGSVVGCESVVTKDIAPLCIVAGNPAKLIRKRDNIPEFNPLYKCFLDN